MKPVLKRLSLILILVGIIGGLWVGLVRGQDILDWARLRGYEPPAEVARLARDTTMTDHGKRLFYVNKPVIADRQTFSQRCGLSEESIVLGCYISNRGIYIYDVQDERLNGVKEVTAAHEMLHAAYDRLSRSQRERIDELTAAAYADNNDRRLEETIERYRQRDPSVVANELHSILPTEVRTLPDELEEYYRQYFADRLVVVTYAENYEEAFTQRQRTIRDYDNRLETLRQTIESDQLRLQSRADNLTAQRGRLDALLAQENYEAYNTGVDDYNRAVREYNDLVAQTEDNIDRYNQLIQERNDIAIEEKQLLDALDSRIKTPAR